MRGSLLRRAGFLLALLAAWATVSRLGVVKPWLLPSPWEVAASFADGLTDHLGPSLCVGKACITLGSVTGGVLLSIKRLLLGYGVSIVAGLILGVSLWRFALLRELLGPIVVGLQALPSVCWLPVAVIWFGLSEAAIVFVVIMGSLLSVAVATEAGIRNVPPVYLRAARTMGARGVTLYRRVVIPAALPGIITGMKLGWVFAWRALMAGELIFVAGGIGQLLKTGQDTNDMARVLAVIALIMALGLAVELLLFARVERRMRERWGYDRE
jgi:NitT/TauT family transport system permease protein